MKHTLFILALITATIQTFAQSPRIKLNQITKDSLTGSVLISSPTDSGMVYSRDLFISYGADTVLILGGDTLAATSGTISSVLSDGVTITGDGTVGSPLTVDTATVIATKQDLDLYYLDSNPDGYTSNTGTVTSVSGTGTVNGISLSGTVTSSGNLTLGGTLSGVDLASQVTGTLPVANGGTGSDTLNFVDLSTTQTVGGAKTFTSALTQSGGDVNFDSGTLFVDATNNKVGIGTTSPQAPLSVAGSIHLLDVDQTSFFDNTFYVYNDTDEGSTAGTTDAEFGFFVAKDGSGSTTDGPNFVMRGNDYTRNTNQKGKIMFYAGSGMAKVGGNGTVEFYGTHGINFKTGAFVDRMFIEDDGDVGIGTTSPSYKLEVNGSVAGVGAYNNLSDVNWKKNIQDITYGVDKILQLKPITFNWLNEDYGDRINIGFIAQEVEEIIPNMVTTAEDGTKSIAITDLIPVLTKAIQEQQAIIESQATKIETLKTLITELSNRLTILENN